MNTQPLKQAATLLSAFPMVTRSPFAHETRHALMDSAGAECWSCRRHIARDTILYCFHDLSILVVSAQSAIAYDDWASAKESH